MEKSRRQRKVIHCDCDCFYAAVETRDNPALAGRPLAVGGRPDQRGVIATCNYEARAFGVRSAMSAARALKLCPDLLILPPRFSAYKAVSRQIHAIFRDYTPLIEPLSLDEAYLDVTDSDACRGSATLMAEEIRSRVREALGITISAGIAPNKFLAKVASDWHKPDGLCVITPNQVLPFVAELPVERLHGVGPATAKRLQERGVRYCADIKRIGEPELVRCFGRFGTRLYELSLGIDERPVRTSRVRKSLGVEHTYAEDLPDLDSCLARLPALYAELCQRLARLEEGYIACKLVLKMKFGDFVQTTVEQGVEAPSMEVSTALCRQAFCRGAKPVRLLGLAVRLKNSSGDRGEQLTLFGAGDAS